MFGYPPRGGPRIRTYTTLQALSRCADVHLRVTQEPDVSDEERAREHLAALCQTAHWPAPSKVPSLPGRALLRLRRAVGSARMQPDAAPQDPVTRLADDARAIGADVIWLGFGGISYYLLPLKRATGLPLVLETESVWSRFILREAPFQSDPARRAEIEREGSEKEHEERAAAAVPDVTTAVSEVDADYFRSLGGDPERVMRLNNVVDVSAFESDQRVADLRGPAVCFPGTLSSGTANVDAVAWLVDDIMPLVWAKRPDTHLYLVGRDPSPEVRARASERVRVVGTVDSVAPYLRAAVAEVVPLRWESGTRFKILEAFACGTPVVSTTLGAEGLDVEDGRHLLLADTPAEIAQCLLRLIEDGLLGERLAEPARRLVREEYDVSTAARQVAAILRRVGVPLMDAWPASARSG